MATTGPVITPGSGGHDWSFTWRDGVLAATAFQAKQGMFNMVSTQKASGEINPDSRATANPDGSIGLHLSKDVTRFFITQRVVVDCTAVLAPSVDGKGTVFQLLNGTLDAGGYAQRSDVLTAVQTAFSEWQAQAQTEPLQGNDGNHLK